jgi:hypothetical protein
MVASYERDADEACAFTRPIHRSMVAEAGAGSNWRDAQAVENTWLEAEHHHGVRPS